MDKINWLLLRGLARESRHWGEFSQALNLQTYSQGVITLDLPGMGSEKHQVAPLSVKATTDEVRERWQKIKSEYPGHWGVIAISLGAMVGIDWVSRYKEDFDSAVFINASARNTSPFWHRLNPRYVVAALKALSISDCEKRERALLQITSNLKRADVVALKLWTKIALDSPTKLSTLYRQMFAAARFRAPQKIDVPVLFLSSEADRMVDYRASKRLSEKYKSKFALHGSAGHDLPLDYQDWVLSRIHEFVEKLG